MNLEIQFYNVWILTSCYYIISTAMVLIMPKYNTGSFVKTPKKKYATPLNQISYYGFLISSVFIPFSENKILFFSGISIFITGLILYVYAVFSFAVKEFDKPVTDRFYSFSRHPVYLSFFILSTGISLASFSPVTGSFACIYFVSSYFIMKEEEKMCVEKYGEIYLNYMKRTGMFIKKRNNPDNTKK